MKKFSKALNLIFILIFTLQAFAIKVEAAAEEETNIVLLIDNSGSMVKTDPYKLSISAASMLIDTAEDNINLNVIGFGERLITPYVLKDKPSREALKAELSGFRFDQDYTDLKEGLEEALKQLEEVQGQKIVIVLSDGKEDPAGGLTDKHTEELNSLMEEAYSSRVQVHTVGLSRYADAETLGRIAFKTGGDYFYCDNPAELFDIYGKILGNINSFYTIESYTTNIKKDKEIKFSSYIDEVIVKVASCENKTPLVDVSQDGTKLFSTKLGDNYKIYRFKNSVNSILKISSGGSGKNLVIVQIKSKGTITINSQGSNFRIPREIPLDIEASLQIDETIMGLHMDKLEGGDRVNIDKKDNSFKFTFEKDKGGRYPVVITAYDGEGNIVAIRNIDVNVTEDPPFYYAKTLPKVIVAERPLVIELRPLDGTEVGTPKGEIIVDYGDGYEQFPLKLENGTLSSEMKLKKAGHVNITACINGVKENESFSYYLPYIQAEVIEKPFIQLEGGKNKTVIKESSSTNLYLNIKKSLLYENERIDILNSRGEKVGEFEVTPAAKGTIKTIIEPGVKGRKLSFILKPQGDTAVTTKINTDIRVLSDFDYYFRWFRLPLIILGTAAILVLAAIEIGKHQYRHSIKKYKVHKELLYSITPDINEDMLNVDLDMLDKEKYLNFLHNTLTVDSEEENALGQFILHGPKGNRIFQGLNYIIKRDSLFYVEYIPMGEEQEIMKNGELIDGKIIFCSDIEVLINVQKKIIKLTFL